LKLGGVLGTALLVAIVTAIGSGLGSDFLDLFRGDEEEPDPISYSATEQVSECGTALFVPEDREGTRLRRHPHSEPDPGLEGLPGRQRRLGRG